MEKDKFKDLTLTLDKCLKTLSKMKIEQQKFFEKYKRNENEKTEKVLR